MIRYSKKTWARVELISKLQQKVEKSSVWKCVTTCALVLIQFSIQLFHPETKYNRQVSCSQIARVERPFFFIFSEGIFLFSLDLVFDYVVLKQNVAMYFGSHQLTQIKKIKISYLSYQLIISPTSEFSLVAWSQRWWQKMKHNCRFPRR